MQYQTDINGLEVHAVYSDESIINVFEPIVDRIKALRNEKGGRVIVFMAAPPAAGKTTMCGLLKKLEPGICVLGMDGFHMRQQYLTTHYITREEREVLMVNIKGAPETFDLERLTAFVKRAAAGEDFGWPVYSRPLHDPVDDAEQVKGDMILIEGNYLLLDEPGWRELKAYADLTISVTAEPLMLRDRLIDRKSASGTPRREAEIFVDTSDIVNARRVLKNSMPADISLRLMPYGEYVLL